MIDPWITDLTEYVFWVQSQIDTTAGDWDTPPDFQDIATTDGSGRDMYILEVDETLVFQDHSHLKVEFSVSLSTAGFEYTTYSYHYSTPTQPIVWRYDKHTEPWFERKYGTECHLHRGSNSKRDMEPTDVVDLADVLDLIPNRGYVADADLQWASGT